MSGFHSFAQRMAECREHDDTWEESDDFEKSWGFDNEDVDWVLGYGKRKPKKAERVAGSEEGRKKKEKLTFLYLPAAPSDD